MNESIFDILPEHIIYNILILCNTKTINNFCTTCKETIHIGTDSYLWLMKLKNDYPDYVENKQWKNNEYIYLRIRSEVDTELDLSDLLLGTERMKIIGKGLEMNRTLIRLNLSNNIKITKTRNSAFYYSIMYNKGIESIANGLKINRTLLELNLSNNNIYGMGAEEIGECLKINRTMTRLNLSNNRINTEGIKAIVNGLEMNQILLYLNLNNNVTCIERKTITKKLKTNRMLLGMKLI
jgi:Ran GTPase-activating protein (RanGAP) involved in mRNA processing and transport